MVDISNAVRQSGMIAEKDSLFSEWKQRRKANNYLEASVIALNFHRPF
jgi:hypothetical protein